jgi:hypothetical protein
MDADRTLGWRDVIDVLALLERGLPQVYPTDPDRETWEALLRLERAVRNDVSSWLRLALQARAAPDSIPPKWAFLVNLRIKWALQLVRGYEARKVAPALPGNQILQWLLIETWETAGCAALQNHVARGGSPHPENPNGETPLGQP